MIPEADIRPLVCAVIRNAMTDSMDGSVDAFNWLIQTGADWWEAIGNDRRSVIDWCSENLPAFEEALDTLEEVIEKKMMRQSIETIMEDLELPEHRVRNILRIGFTERELRQDMKLMEVT